MNELEILKKAYAIIQDPKKWCQGCYTKPTIDGNNSRFCAVGAIIRAQSSFEIGSNEDYKFIDNLIGKLDEISYRLFKKTNVAKVNDFMGHKQVLEVYSVAINEIENQESY